MCRSSVGIDFATDPDRVTRTGVEVGALLGSRYTRIPLVAIVVVGVIGVAILAIGV